MKDLIGCCGYDCAGCPLYKATMGIEREDGFVFPEGTRCKGCLSSERYHFCDRCQVRKCVLEKGHRTCADCAILDTCPIIGQIFMTNPKAKESLDILRKEKEV